MIQRDPQRSANLERKDRRPYLWRGIFLAVILIAAHQAIHYPWGRWPRGWTTWQIEPANAQNTAALTTLLTQDREEVRFWQENLFHISLAFVAAILAIVSFAVKTMGSSESLRFTYTVGVVFLCAFYLIFVTIAEQAIALNHHDLIGIEIALGLSKENQYIQGQSIYDHSEANQKNPKGETFVKRMVPFAIALGVLAAAGVLFLPVPEAADPRAEE